MDICFDHTKELKLIETINKNKFVCLNSIGVDKLTLYEDDDYYELKYNGNTVIFSNELELIYAIANNTKVTDFLNKNISYIMEGAKDSITSNIIEFIDIHNYTFWLKAYTWYMISAHKISIDKTYIKFIKFDFYTEDYYFHDLHDLRKFLKEDLVTTFKVEYTSCKKMIRGLHTSELTTIHYLIMYLDYNDKEDLYSYINNKYYRDFNESGIGCVIEENIESDKYLKDYMEKAFSVFINTLNYEFS